jgi:hypothetical protein
MKKYLYGTKEARVALGGIGTQKLYGLINNGTLDARRFGHRTYITAESLEAFAAALPAVMTPTLAKAAGIKWPDHNPWTDVQKDEAK